MVRTSLQERIHTPFPALRECLEKLSYLEDHCEDMIQKILILEASLLRNYLQSFLLQLGMDFFKFLEKLNLIHFLSPRKTQEGTFHNDVLRVSIPTTWVEEIEEDSMADFEAPNKVILEPWIYEEENMVRENSYLRAKIKNPQLLENLPQDVAFTINIHVYKDLVPWLVQALDEPGGCACQLLGREDLGTNPPVENFNQWLTLGGKGTRATPGYKRMLTRALRSHCLLLRQNTFFFKIFLDSRLRLYNWDVDLNPQGWYIQRILLSFKVRPNLEDFEN